MKKVLLTMMMLLFAFTGVMRAETVEIGTGTGTTYMVPFNSLYGYSFTEQVFLASEIGTAGTINSISFNLAQSYTQAQTNNYVVYMKNVSRETFTATTDYEPVTAADVVFSGAWEIPTNTTGWITLTLDTPFAYDGTSNLMFAMFESTSGYSTRYFVCTDVSNSGISYYSDSYVPDPYNLASYGGSKALRSKRNNIQLDITPGGGGPVALTTEPATLDLGARPNGAWMAPYKFQIKSSGTTNVTAMDLSGSYYTYNAELPATVNAQNPLEVEITTGDAEPGIVNSTLTVLYGSNRDAAQFDVTARAYDPVDGDVWENAINVTNFPYSANGPEQIYKNYELGAVTTAPEAMYKLAFNNDVLLTAGTSETDSVATLYTEDFYGEGGPMADNNYVYTGPEVNPGPLSMWFSYSYTGSNTFFGSSAGGQMIFGYKIPAAYLQELGLGACAITTVEAAAREGTFYDLIIMKGGDTPDFSNMVYYQEFNAYTPYYFFDLNLDEPQFLGDDENIWVMFYSDSPYAAYCGKQPVDVNNGKIWYAMSGTNPTWYSNTTYTPQIYTRFLELPTGREVTMNLADLTIRESQATTGQLGETEGNVMNVARAQRPQKRNAPDNMIDGMYVPAGTYYLAVASATTNFPVSVEIADVPAPEQAIIVSPADGATNVTAPWLAEWYLGDYTEEMQVLVGTQYPPQTILIDWTDYLVESAFIMDLEPNQSYFMQVNERNAAGTTYGEIVAFTTPIDGVEGLAVENDELYPGDAANFSWTANSRTLQGYNLYVADGGVLAKVNDTPITTNAYSLEGLEYNMDGYQFAVTAVYDAGESDFSDVVYVYMTGNGTVSGGVYDQDDEHPVPFATVTFEGYDEYAAPQTFTLTTGEDGTFTGEILAGEYTAYVVTEGYDPTEGVPCIVYYNQETANINLYTHEFYYPVGQVTATEEEDDVLVEWSWDPAEYIVDFETGDFSQAEFILPAQYPWTVTTTNPYEGTYCMKSTCEGQASATSSIEVTVEVPFDEAKMGFYVRTSSEANYDKFFFYIDGVQQGQALSGQNPYAYKEYSITGGTHTYKWAYTKDSSVNSNDDCIYVDNITLYRKDEPIPPTPGATTYTFDNSTMEGWTTIDANNDGYTWVLGSEVGGVYLASGASLAGSGHNESADLVCSGSYSNATSSAITPDNYLVAPAQISAQAGASISFYACAQDASYAAEHFGVFVSTTTATASAFTMVQEWTMTAKGPQGSTAENAQDIRGTRAQGLWYLYNVDLSSFAGQDIWVAIRHFNCNDMFILNVDDITLYDGSAKPMARDLRSFQSFNVYRRNNIVNEEPTLLAEGVNAETFEYVDAEWPSLPYGEWQWGVAATYDGYAPVPENRDVLFTDTFEDGALTNWSTVDADGDGDTWQNATPAAYGIGDAHSGTNCASSWSWNNYSMDPDNWMISPMVEGATTLQYYVATNTGYPDHYGVYASSTGTATSDFTLVFQETAGSKGVAGVKSSMTQAGTRDMSTWAEKNIDLPAGTKYVAFRHWDSYDMNYLFIDDVTISGSSAPVPPTPGPVGSGISEIIWSNVIEKDMEATLTFNVQLSNGQNPDGAAVSVVSEEHEYTATVEDGMAEIVVRKGETYDMTVALEGYTTFNLTDLIEDDEEYDVTLVEIIANVDGLYVSPTGWAKWEGLAGGGVTPTPTPGEGSEFTESFETGVPSDWTALDADGDGHNWIRASVGMAGYSITPHSGDDFVYSESYNGSAGALTPDNFLVTPQVTLVNGSTFSFWAAAQDASYAAEHFGVAVSDNGTSNWTMVQEWTMTAKEGERGPRGMNAMGNYYQYTVDLSQFAGQKYIAIRHFNCTDWFYLDVDDAELSINAKGNRAPVAYKVMLDGVYEGETVYPYFQHNVDDLEIGSTHTTSVAALYVGGMSEWVTYDWTLQDCADYQGVTSFTAEQEGTDVVLNWTLPGGPTPPPTPGTGQWYYYDNGVNDNNIGASGPFYWAVMFPAGSYTGDYVTKVATYDAGNPGYAFTGTATIYLGGTNTPGTAVGTVNVATTGATADFVEYEFSEPVAIDDAQNLWVVFYNATSTSYCAAAYAETGAGDANARWVSLDGSSWMDLATAGISGYGWMLRVYVAEGAKGEVHEITVPTQACNNAGELSAAPVTNRAMWDLEFEFNGTSGYQYGVASDGEYIYTSSWSASSTSQFYKYDLQGNFIEEFNISGSGQCRGLTYDGQYFYGVANSSTIYCLDLANHTLVGTTNSAYGAMRCITYDPVRDGFWVVGNWSGNVTLVSRTGAIVQTGGTPTSASDVAYYKDVNDVEHVLCFNNGTNDVDDYNITTNTMGGSVFNFNSNPNVTGSSGGCFVGPYNGKTCFFGDIQQSPQHIAIYELDANGPTPPGPQPVEGLVGAVLYRNGEIVGLFDAETTSFIDEGAESGENNYCIRVIYGGDPDVTLYAMSCLDDCELVDYECKPVTNLSGTYHAGDEPYVTLTWANEYDDEALYYEVYYNDTLAGTTSELTYDVYFDQREDLEFGVVAVYLNCESEMVTCTVTVTGVEEFNGNVNIYPNPTNSNVTIEAASMKHITVVSALGQVVYDADVDADMIQLNLGQFKAGVYMVRIDTENGVTVKRVNVVK